MSERSDARLRQRTLWRAAAPLAIAAAAMTGGCMNRPSNLPAGDAAYAIFPPATTGATTVDRSVIGPSDAISIAIFNEPDLGTPSVRVDTAGNVNMPLIGSVNAAGKTTVELAREIEGRLRSGGFLTRPLATVNLVEAVSQRVTIEGEVNQPGVFPLTGPTTLIDTIALARGTTRLADLDEVAIFRVIDGQQMAAKFDVKAIRRGEVPNPVIQGNDIVVVGFNNLSSAWRDFLQAAPAFTLFSRPFF